MNANEILKKYTLGELTLTEANKKLKDIDAGFHLDINKNLLTDEEITNGTAGLLDTGTGSLDKVRIANGELVNADVGDMYALLTVGGRTFRVKGNKLFEI